MQSIQMQKNKYEFCSAQNFLKVSVQKEIQIWHLNYRSDIVQFVVLVGLLKYNRQCNISYKTWFLN